MRGSTVRAEELRSLQPRPSSRAKVLLTPRNTRPAALEWAAVLLTAWSSSQGSDPTWGLTCPHLVRVALLGTVITDIPYTITVTVPLV